KKVLLSASFATLHNLYRDYNRLFLSLFFPNNCIIDSLSQSFLVEFLPYLMQLLFGHLKFLGINFSVACICSLCQLIDVITNRSQLLCYLNRPRFINLGGLHAIPQCPLFRKSWHTHMIIVRCLLQFFIFVVAHTKFNLSIIFPVLSHKSHLVLLIFLSSILYTHLTPTSYCSFFIRNSKHLNVFLLFTFYHAFSVVASSIFGTQITLVFAVAKMPPSPHLHGGISPCLF